MAKDYDNARLGGPQGLYDSPNWDREGTGGIVQRVRVPDQASPPQPEQLFAFGTVSLNDSDNALDAGAGEKPIEGVAEDDPEMAGNLAKGIAFSKSIRGSNM